MKSLYLPDWESFIRYYETPGNGKTILYLAGLSFSVLGSMLPVATHERMRKFPGILVDYLGAGFSDHPSKFDYRMESHAHSIAKILDHEGINEVAVVGHSMGGTVAIMLALARPDLVSNLIVAEGNVTSGGGAATREIAAHDRESFVDVVYPSQKETRRQSAILGDHKSDQLNNLWATTDPVGLYSNSKALVEIDDSLKEKFLQLPIAKTFIYGDKTFPENARGVGPDTPDPAELEAHGVNVAIVPKAGHSQISDNLDGFVDILTTALDR